MPRDIRSAPAPSNTRWTCGPGAEFESILTDIIALETETPTSFAELMLAPELLRGVEDAGYTTPTPIQARAIPLILNGRDIMGLAQTGTGKTAAFTLPIVQRLLGGPRRTRALILTPTRELAVQVRETFARYASHSGLEITVVYGGVPLGPQEQALRAGVDVIVATPGRLLDHMERQNVAFDDLEVLVLDEADRMLDMGFAPSWASRSRRLAMESSMARADAATARQTPPSC